MIGEPLWKSHEPRRPMLWIWLLGVIVGAGLVTLGAWLNAQFGFMAPRWQQPASVESAPPASIVRAFEAPAQHGDKMRIETDSKSTPSTVSAIRTADFLVKAVQRVAPAVVCVRGYEPAQWRLWKLRPDIPSGLASGVIFDGGHGYVVTNAHVLEDGSRWRVQLIDGREFRAEKVAEDKPTDLAVLRIIGPQKLPEAKFGRSADVPVGAWVIAIGNPYGRTHTVTVGVVSAKGRDLRDRTRFITDVIQTDAPINPGNSGGPLCNVEGEVIGINTAINLRGWGIGYAIASDLVKQVISRLVEHKRVERPWLGVEYTMISEDERRQLKLREEKGLIITSVQAGSSADRAGLRGGDIIVAINGELVRDLQHLRQAITNAGIGGRLTLRIFRRGRYRTVTVRIGTMPVEKVLRNEGWR